MNRVIQYFILMAAVLVSSMAQASTITSLVGDKDGFGIGLNANSVRPAVVPNSSLFWDARTSSDPTFTDHYPAINFSDPGASLSYTHTFSLPTGATTTSASLSLFMFGVQDGDNEVVGSNTDIKLWMNGVEVANAFDTVDQFFNGYYQGQFRWLEKTGMVNFDVPASVLTSGNLKIDLQILQLGTASVLDAIAIDYSELTINYDERQQQPVPEPATFILLGAGLGGFALYRRKMKR